MTDLVHHLDKDDRGMLDPSDPGEPAGPGKGRRRISVTREEGALLAGFAHGQVLEIGTGLGVATRWLARTANAVYTVDIDPWVQEQVWPRLPTNVTCLPELPGPAGYRYDLVFIDAEHTHEALTADIAYARHVTGHGALIVVHDAIELRETVRAQPGDWQIISTRYGLGIHARV